MLRTMTKKCALVRFSNQTLILCEVEHVPNIGLSMIVKNEAATIRPCLASVRELVNQIVIADTGCTDDTCDIAREFGATIISVPWDNNFANARNVALRSMSTDWVLVLDADEELDRGAAAHIATLLSGNDVGGYTVPIRNYMLSRFNRGWDRVGVPNDYCHERARKAPSYIAHENCRLFRRHPGIYFTGRIHELVEHQIRTLGLKLLPAPFFIHHFGQLVGEEAREQKRVFYRDLLRAKTEETPDDPVAWTQLGLHEFECFNQPEEALRCFERALTLQPTAPETWLFTGMVFLKLERFQEALSAIEHDRRSGTSFALREDLRGDALYGVGRHKEAMVAYRRALKLLPDNPLLESKLGYTEVKLGHKNAGLARLRHAAEAVPELHPVNDRLMKACIMAGRLEEAADVAEKYTQIVGHPKLFLRAASIRARLKQWGRAQEIILRGLQLFPESENLQTAHAEVSSKCCNSISRDAKSDADPPTREAAAVTSAH
jgi:tetratricopeptide (TPR) repeat protein